MRPQAEDSNLARSGERQRGPASTRTAATMRLGWVLYSMVLIASCCPPAKLVPVIAARPCLTRPAPRVPAGAVFGTPPWIAAYTELWRWVVASEAACGVEVPGDEPAEGSW